MNIKLKEFIGKIKNDRRGPIVGVIIFSSIILFIYILTEFSLKKEEKIETPKIDLKIVEGTDNSTLANKEEQIEKLIEYDKDRSKNQDFYIKTAYYLDDEDKRKFDGKIVDLKDIEIEEDIKVEIKKEPLKIKTNILEENIKKPDIDLIEEKAADLILDTPKEENLYKVSPELKNLDEENKLKYKLERLAALNNMIGEQNYNPISVSIKENIKEEKVEISLIEEKQDLYIVPGSSFTAYLQNNLNTTINNSVAIINFTSPKLRGYKGIGVVAPNSNKTGLGIAVNQIITPLGKRIPVTAFAIDTENYSASFADEVDTKALKRFALTSASVILNAFGAAKSEVENSGTETVVNGDYATTNTPRKNFSNLFYGNVASNTSEKVDNYLIEELKKTEDEVKVNANKQLIVIFY